MDPKVSQYPATRIVEVDEVPCDLRGVADCVLVMQQWGWKLVGAAEPDRLVQRLRFERVLSKEETMVEKIDQMADDDLDDAAMGMLRERARLTEVAPVLHVFTCDHEEWVIATTPDDARDVFCKHMGFEPVLGPKEDDSKEFGTHESQWEQLPDDKLVNVAEECSETHGKDRLVDGKPCPKGCDAQCIIRHSKPASEWAKQGRGYLASANW